ncbi:V-set domain-containing T-cell activation inhibitor 1-like [Centropristis striata]|uniref:V-set domain-containing T-cell activation inhibitor 1-like n=1 Tax=Centropristis striata TaxID=184440 RepID=UPI0027E0DC03|nr:V-set domain-containing T-cell activation inhibitor 1-like [Centropristis striata]
METDSLLDPQEAKRGTAASALTSVFSFRGAGVVRVAVQEGGDVVLPCSRGNKENVDKTVFDWKKDGLEVFFYEAGKHYNNGREGQSEQFKGRVSHFQDELKHGNASIRVQKTKMADSGNYTCTFPKKQTSHITLFVDPDPERSVLTS